MAGDWDDLPVLDLLGDRTVRAILVVAQEQPRPVKEIAEACDVAPSTIYRHVDDMLAADLLVERTKVETDGSHHSVYEANVDHVDVDLARDGFVIEVQASQSPSERFTRIWDDIRKG
ncbi:MAG: ArsR/SmtB family transcription factor [Salinigranum sp.]